MARKTKRKDAPQTAQTLTSLSDVTVAVEDVKTKDYEMVLTPSRKALQVLVVDELNAETPVTHALSYSGHTVIKASRAFEALEALQRHTFDLIFIDLGETPLETFGTTELIVAFRNAQTQQIPIIALGPELPPSLEEKCSATGVTRITSGRLNGETLQLVLAKVTQGNNDDGNSLSQETLGSHCPFDEHIWTCPLNGEKPEETASYSWKDYNPKSGQAHRFQRQHQKKSGSLNPVSLNPVGKEDMLENAVSETRGRGKWGLAKRTWTPAL